MPAKDVVDVDIECAVGTMQVVIASLSRVGFVHEGDLGIESREVFLPIVGTEAFRLPNHHLYACESGAPELRRHLALRDYLIAHPGRRDWLAGCKVEADRTARSRSEYIENKSAAYECIVQESLAWVAELDSS